MAWGARANLGIEDLVARVAADEPQFFALALLPSRRFGDAEAAALAAALRTNTGIAELHLGGRKMSAESARLLAEALVERAREPEEEAGARGRRKSASSLRALSVGDASFGCAGAAALAPALSHAGALCGELDLELRGIGVEGARALAEAVVEARRQWKKRQGGGGAKSSCSSFLQSLNLARNPLLGGDKEACEALSAALFDEVAGDDEEKEAVLTSLDLSDCRLSSAGVAALVRESGEASSSPPSSSPLLSLRLERNAELDEVAAVALGRALKAKLRGLRHLSLSGCGPLLGDAAAREVSSAFACSRAPGSSLRSLDLSGCGVGPLGAEHLAAALGSEGCELEKLKLSGGGGEGEEKEEKEKGATMATKTKLKTLGNEGALLLARALAEASSFSTLRDLDLSSCGISSAEAAAALLLRNPSSGGSSSSSSGRGLDSLTLAGNPLGDAGASAVAAALAEMTKASSEERLEHLDLAACGIGLEGAAALADALLLRMPTTATTTATSEEGGEGKEQEGGSFSAAPRLRTLVLGGNPATEDDAFAESVVARLRDARPELDVAWRSGDQHAAAAEKK